MNIMMPLGDDDTCVFLLGNPKDERNCNWIESIWIWFKVKELKKNLLGILALDDTCAAFFTTLQSPFSRFPIAISTCGKLSKNVIFQVVDKQTFWRKNLIFLLSFDTYLSFENPISPIKKVKALTFFAYLERQEKH